jgi:tetratricopeptide (TPR) repeat protein
LKKYCLHSIFSLVLLSALTSCSTQKNTWLSRKYNSTTARYNINFNGRESYLKGLKALQNAHQEDYTHIIPMYPVSNHEIVNSASTDMDRTIEKSRKAIKLRSIKQKPKRNLQKWTNPQYRAFYNQQEFNPMIKEAWLLLGQAEFHKGDFIGAIGTFGYIERHYADDNDIVAQCRLWKARAYGELDWYYDADQIIRSISQEELKYATTGLLASVTADVLLKQKQYKDAIPYLELALSREKDKYQKRRFTYLLAQLYKETGENKAAYERYKSIIRKNPPYEMEFNARIAMTQLGQQSQKEVLKMLRKMARNSKNKDYLDQLYYAVGNIHLNNNDTVNAIANFVLSAEKSTRNGIDKAVTLITLGDLYYLQQKYVEAQPAYEEASQILSNEHEEYARVYKKATTLGEFVIEYNIVTLQDSLLHLSTLPESEQLAAANRAVQQVIEEEKAAEKAAELSMSTNESGPVLQQIAGDISGKGGWYFYNPSSVNAGKSEFQKRWGRRKLEDNWRRLNKTAGLFAETTENNTEEAASDENTVASDTIEKVSDNKSPEFYLQQIPKTQAQKDAANAQIATSLFKMAIIYKDKIEDYPMAVKTFEEFIRRFGQDERILDAYFNIFQICYKSGNTADAEHYRKKILNEYSDSRQAKILATPDFERQMRKMYFEQDSIYNLTYKSYSNNDFNTVFGNKEYVEKNYPLSTLMPKFMFLEALSLGKTQSDEKFEAALSNLVEQYPNSDVSAMSKDILALLRQGLVAQEGQTHGSLLSRRNDAELAAFAEAQGGEAATLSYSTNKTGKHRLMLITAAEPDDLNRLLYQIASFNFSRFMIKDFDLNIHTLDKTATVLSVMGLDSYEEAIWYKTTLTADSLMNNLLTQMHVESIAISEQNFETLAILGMDEYKKSLPDILSAKDVEETILAAHQQPETPPATENNRAEETASRPASGDKPSADPVESTRTPSTAVPEEPQSPPAETAETVAPTPQPEPQPEPEEEPVPLYKGLFGYRENEPHYIALYIVNGTPDFEKVKSDFDAYNAQNYSPLNLNITLENFEKQQVVIIGSFGDANIAKSYLLRMVKERQLFEGMKSTSYRNLIGSQKNLNTMIQNNALNTYFEFMQEFYLK